MNTSFQRTVFSQRQSRFAGQYDRELPVRFRPLRKSGFTLVEIMVSISLMAFAASVILLAVETSVDNSAQSIEKTIAAGMAKQLMNEVLGKRYKSAGTNPYQYPLSASNWERNGIGRERFDATGDFNGFLTQGAQDRWGNPLGKGDDVGSLRNTSFRVPDGYFDRWEQYIQVYYVDENDPSERLPAWQTSNFRAVEVTISKKGLDNVYRELASLRRVYVYVPPPF